MIILESKGVYYNCHVLHSEFTLVTPFHIGGVYGTLYIHIYMDLFLYKILHSYNFQGSILWSLMSDFKEFFFQYREGCVELIYQIGNGSGVLSDVKNS